MEGWFRAGRAPPSESVVRFSQGGLAWLAGVCELRNARSRLTEFRAYGLLLDNLVSAEVVLASGETLTASNKHHPDLFWVSGKATVTRCSVSEASCRADAKSRGYAGPDHHSPSATRSPSGPTPCRRP
jgi:hypothetical protein